MEKYKDSNTISRRSGLPRQQIIAIYHHS